MAGPDRPPPPPTGRDAAVGRIEQAGEHAITSPFAAGERYVNGGLAASADGYIDEVTRHPEKAQRQFTEASEAFAAQRE